jgi:NADPH:quinone reductase-like Zn-dependent oxidoreductase
MKAIAINGFGDYDVLEMREFPVPHPGSNQVLVKIEATNF